MVNPGDTALVTAQASSQDTKIVPTLLTIDNLHNNGTVTVNFGTYNFSVPPFQREKFSLPDSATKVSIANGATIGTVNAWFSDMPLADSQSNNLLIQQTAAATLTYQYQTYSVTTAQQTTDLNKSILFAGQVAPINYNLQAIAGNVGNGWLQYVNNQGGFAVSIVPSGADTINGVFTAGSPLVLNPGDSGILTSDGAGNWYYQGKVSFRSTNIALALNGLSTQAHKLGKKPEVVRLLLVCLVADSGYSVGDELNIDFDMFATAGTTRHTAVVVGATTLSVRQNNNSIARDVQLFGGGTASIVPADWAYVVTMAAWY